MQDHTQPSKPASQGHSWAFLNVAAPCCMSDSCQTLLHADRAVAVLPAGISLGSNIISLWTASPGNALSHPAFFHDYSCDLN